MVLKAFIVLLSVFSSFWLLFFLKNKCDSTQTRQLFREGGGVIRSGSGRLIHNIVFYAVSAIFRPYNGRVNRPLRVTGKLRLEWLTSICTQVSSQIIDKLLLIKSICNSFLPTHPSPRFANWYIYSTTLVLPYISGHLHAW